MGLMCSVSPTATFLFPEATRHFGITPDYGPGNTVFQQTFLRQSKTLVPVRTGNLMASLSSEINGDEIISYTTCQYAEFVEYGTWKQAAQPYFEDAIYSALLAAQKLWYDAMIKAFYIEWGLLFIEILTEIEAANPKSSGGIFLEEWAKNAAWGSIATQFPPGYIASPFDFVMSHSEARSLVEEQVGEFETGDGFLPNVFQPSTIII